MNLGKLPLRKVFAVEKCFVWMVMTLEVSGYFFG